MTKQGEPAKTAAATTAQVKILNGDAISSREMDLALFAAHGLRPRLLKQVVVGYQANQRQGTHKTKTRAETSYSEAKPWPQKHTGRARAGDRNSPLWRHGGTIFGPVPRDYRHHTPRKMLREALRSALFGKFSDGEVSFIENLAFDKPSTKRAVGCLKRLGIEKRVTIVVPKGSETLYRSFRNIPRCEVVPASDVNALSVLRASNLVFVGSALAEVEQRLVKSTAAV